MAAEETPPVIPDFVLLRRIGAGSYGEVWLARGVTGMFRAVKIVYRKSFNSERPYRREFEGVSRYVSLAVGEPSQLAVLHAGQAADESYFFYVMELADDVARGREIDAESYMPLTLQQLKEREGGRLPVRRSLEVGLALATGLATLHRHGLVHRDIKPSNVVLVGGVPKLADIGLVAEAEAGRTFVGTETYGAPEGPGQPAADVFSLARVLYELWSGQAATEWPKGLREAERAEKEEAEWAAVLARAGSFVVSRRHDNATALRDDLLLLQAGRSVRRLRLAERTAARLRRGLVAALVVGLVAGAAAVLAIRVERERAEVANAGKRQAEEERDALARRTVYAAELARAQRALENDDYGAARRHLKAAVPPGGDETLKGFEWHVLWKQAQGNATRILRESGPRIEQIAWNEFRKSHFVLERDGTVDELRSDSDELVGIAEDVRFLFSSYDVRFPGPAVTLQNGDLSVWKDNRLIPLGSRMTDSDLAWPIIENSSIYVVNTDVPSLIRVVDLAGANERLVVLPIEGISDYRLHRDHFAISPGGRYFAGSFIKGNLAQATWRWVVFDFVARRVIWDSPCQHGIGSIAVNDTGTSVVTFPERNEYLIHHENEKAPLVVRDSGAANSARLDFSGTSNFLGVNDMGELHLFELGAISHDLGCFGLSNNAPEYSVSRSGGRILGGDESGRIALWSGWPVTADSKGNSPVTSEVTFPAGMFPRIAYNGKMERFFFCTPRDGVVSIPVNRDASSIFSGLGQQVIGFDKEMNAIRVATSDGAVETRIISNGKITSRVPTEAGQVLTTSWAPDFSGFAVMYESGSVYAFSDTGELLFRFQAHVGTGQSLLVSPESKRIVTSGSDGWIRLWNGETGEMLKARRVWPDARPGSYYGLLTAAGASWFVAKKVGSDTPIELIRFSDLESFAQVNLEGDGWNAAAISPALDRLVVSSRGDVLQIFSLPDLQPVLSLTFHSKTGEVAAEPLVSLVFDSPHQRILGLTYRTEMLEMSIGGLLQARH